MQVLYILFVFSFCSLIQADNSCIFTHPTKGVVNLTSIGLRNGQPRFRDVSPSISSYYYYSFNPCYSFTESNCQDVAVCQVTTDRLYSFSLAKQDSSRWTIDSFNRPVLTYTYGVKTVSITMVCSSSNQDEFEPIGEDVSNHYPMQLRSRCACWNGCSSHVLTSTTPRTPMPTTHSITYSSCRYHDSTYGTIDLSSIGDQTGDPTFRDVASMYPSNYVWSYNPCYKFSEDNCQNVAGCQIDQARSMSYPIGMQEYTYWINMNNTKNLPPSIVYRTPSNNRRLTVQLICDRSLTSHRLQVLGETSVGEYVMQLTSRCACWNGCKSSPEPYNWNFWIIASSVAGVVFFLFLIMITCLFCSKPKRRYPVMIINEKTPFIQGDMKYHS